jgi:Holin of 3TMs, for gene-transfer release
MAKEKDSNWMQQLWRPMMGWMYMLICVADMMVFPVLWALWQGINHVPITQWNPLTLQGAGLFHIAMGAVLGISAFGRTQEKLAGTAANPTATSQTMTSNTNMSGVPAGMQGGMGGGFGGGSSMGGGFGGQSSFGGSSGGFGSPAPSFGSAPAFGSTPAPAFGSTTPSSGFSSGFSGTTPAPAVTPTTNASGQKVVPQSTQPLM